MKSSLISVIITTKNASRTLDRCLKSIKNQSYKHIELIVVDNNSTDNTQEIAREYTSKVYNKGPERSAQRNFGARKAKGKYLLIHDSDIYFDRNSVKECVKMVEKTGCDAIILPEKSIGEGYWTKVKAFERSFYVGNDLIEAARFFDRKTFFEVGGYDRGLTACEDWDLQNRIREKGYKTFRVKIFLLHDEGKLSLFGNSKKKRYYAKWIKIYKERYPDLAKKQFSFFYRFTLKKSIFNTIRHPFLMLSLIIMKSTEYVRTQGV